MAKGAETGEAGSAAQTAGAKVPQRAPTMMDVAFAAGVSQTTVSLVLNDVSTGRFSADTRHRVQEAAKAIYRALGCKGLARVDMFLTEDGTVVLNEVNTMPGMTSYSRYPRMMAAAGLSLAEVIDRLVTQALRGSEK